MAEDIPGDARLLTYAELGELLGIEPESAKRRAVRHGWRRVPGNEGRTLVAVPMTALPVRPAPPGTKGTQSEGRPGTFPRTGLRTSRGTHPWTGPGTSRRTAPTVPGTSSTHSPWRWSICGRHCGPRSVGGPRRTRGQGRPKPARTRPKGWPIGAPRSWPNSGSGQGGPRANRRPCGNRLRPSGTVRRKRPGRWRPCGQNWRPGPPAAPWRGRCGPFCTGGSGCDRGPSRATVLAQVAGPMTRPSLSKSCSDPNPGGTFGPPQPS